MLILKLFWDTGHAVKQLQVNANPKKTGANILRITQLININRQLKPSCRIR